MAISRFGVYSSGDEVIFLDIFFFRVSKNGMEVVQYSIVNLME